MGLNKLISALLLSACGLFASSDVKALDQGFGMDLRVGAGKVGINTPFKYRYVPVTGVDLNGYSITTPAKKTINDLSLGLNLYYNFSEDHELPLKTGVRLDGNFSMNNDYTDENNNNGNGGFPYKNYVIFGKVDWGLPDGSWPKVGVYVDLDQWNLLNVEKGLWQSESRDHIVSATGELTYYDVKWKYFATKQPYGDDWNGSWIDTIKTQGIINHDNGFAGRLGVKYTYNPEDDLYFSGEFSKDFNLTTDSVAPNFYVAIGAGGNF